MNIYNKKELENQTGIIHEHVIDLTSPDGNAFALIALAKRLAKQLDKDGAEIIKEMQSGDYEHLLQVFDREFGEHVTLIR
jgi:hypothetical protein